MVYWFGISPLGVCRRTCHEISGLAVGLATRLIFDFSAMAFCVVCNCSLDMCRIKNLRDVNFGKGESKNLADLVLEMIATVGGKNKICKLLSEQSCLPCFRRLSSFAELRDMVYNQQSEIITKVLATLAQHSKSSKKKSVKWDDKLGGLTLIKEPIIPRPTEDILNHISLRSIISMDAEITITEEENGGAAIDFQVVEGISDLQKENGLFGCRFCKREFSKSTFAINHMLEVHGKLLHKCDTCSQEFRLKDELDQHKMVHLKDGPFPYQCGSCPKGFHNLAEFREHSKNHESRKKFGCGQCGRKYDDEIKLNQHMANHKSKPYFCFRCKKTFRSHNSCLRHQKTHSENQRFSCNLCSKQFTSAENLHVHLKNHNKPFRYVVWSSSFFPYLLTDLYFSDVECVAKVSTRKCNSTNTLKVMCSISVLNAPSAARNACL